MRRYEQEPGMLTTDHHLYACRADEVVSEGTELSIEFGPLGLADGIPSEVFATLDGSPPSFEHASEILELVLKILEDTEGLTLEEFEEYMQADLGVSVLPEDSL